MFWFHLINLYLPLELTSRIFAKSLNVTRFIRIDLIFILSFMKKKWTISKVSIKLMLCCCFHFTLAILLFIIIFLVHRHKRYTFFKNIIYSLRRIQMAYCRNCMNNASQLSKSNSNANNVNNVNNEKGVNVRRSYAVKKIHPVPMLVQRSSKSCK